MTRKQAERLKDLAQRFADAHYYVASIAFDVPEDELARARAHRDRARQKLWDGIDRFVGL